MAHALHRLPPGHHPSMTISGSSCSFIVPTFMPWLLTGQQVPFRRLSTTFAPMTSAGSSAGLHLARPLELQQVRQSPRYTSRQSYRFRLDIPQDQNHHLNQNVCLHVANRSVGVKNCTGVARWLKWSCVRVAQSWVHGTVFHLHGRTLVTHANTALRLSRSHVSFDEG